MTSRASGTNDVRSTAPQGLTSGSPGLQSPISSHRALKARTVTTYGVLAAQKRILRVRHQPPRSAPPACRHPPAPFPSSHVRRGPPLRVGSTSRRSRAPTIQSRNAPAFRYPESDLCPPSSVVRLPHLRPPPAPAAQPHPEQAKRVEGPAHRVERAPT